MTKIEKIFRYIGDKLKKFFIGEPKKTENIFVAVAKFRGIKILTHFTKIENLPSIAQRGLLTLQHLRERKINYLYNDTNRFDNLTNSLSLSITFSNYKMFYPLSKNSQNDWAIILLDAEKILANLPCAFNYTNAANGAVSNIPLKNRMTLDAFKKMFYEPEGSSRKSRNLSDTYTTDPQAEILCLADIPLEYFVGIVFKNSARARDYKKFFPNISCKVDDDYYFKWRHDWRYWKKDSNSESQNSAPYFEEPTFDDDIDYGVPF